MYGGAGDDHLQGLSGNDTLYGGSGDDFLQGGNDMDYLEGGGGGDVIQGGGGDDIIIGGEGNDKLYGGGGDDTFNFSLGDGVDTIYDFAGGDILHFDGISLNSGDTFNIAASGDDVVITVIGGNSGATNTVTLKDAAVNMDTATRDALSNDGGGSYSVTDAGNGNGIEVVIDTPS